MGRKMAQRHSEAILRITLRSIGISSRCSIGFGSRARYAEKDDPHPQVVTAFGLVITNCAPARLS